MNALVESHKARMLPFMDSINQALTRIGEFFGIIALTYLPENIELRRITETGDAEFKKMSLEDFIGRYDIEIDPRSIKAATRDLRKKQIFDMITLAAQTGTDPNNGGMFVDMRALWKELLLTHEIPFNDILMDEAKVFEVQKRGKNNMVEMDIEAQQKMAQAQQAMQPPAPQGMPPEGVPQPGNPEEGALLQEMQ